MIYAGGQYLLFYRLWLLLTRICHPQNPHVLSLVLFYRLCRESDPSFCQSRHALKQSMWFVWLYNLFMFIWNQQGFTWAHIKRSQRHLGNKASPRKNLEQHTTSREYLQWPQQWPCFMGYVGGQALLFYRPWLLHGSPPICHPLCHFMVYAGGSTPIIL